MSKYKELIEAVLNEEEAKVDKHHFILTVSDPGRQAVSRRSEKMMKKVNVTSKNGAEAAKIHAKKVYQKKGYRVHDIEHLGVNLDNQ